MLDLTTRSQIRSPSTNFTGNPTNQDLSTEEPSSTNEIHASKSLSMRELLAAGKIQRIGKARRGHPFRYFKPSF